MIGGIRVIGVGQREHGPFVSWLLTWNSLRLFRWLLGVYIYLLVLLPSGSIFGFNIKFLWFFLLLATAVHMFFRRGHGTKFRTVLLFAVPAVLLAWLPLSLFYGFEPAYAIAQYKDLMVTIISCWFAVLLCAEGQSETVYFLRVVVFSEVTASSLKALLLAYALLRGIPVPELVERIRDVFGVSLMTYGFASMLGRIQFISDGLIPICIFAILRYRKTLRFSATGALSMLLLLLLSDVFSFSRYFWAFTVLAVTLGLLLGKKDKFQLALITVLGGVVLVSLPLLSTVVMLRFSSDVAASSDQERTTQILALDNFFEDAPVLGHGLGSYSRRVIRNDDAPYSYEDQLLALAGQIGVLGIGILLLLTLYYFADLWPRPDRGILPSLGLMLMLLAWITAGFFNPEVISSAASVSYAAIFAMAKLAPEREPLHNRTWARN